MLQTFPLEVLEQVYRNSTGKCTAMASSILKNIGRELSVILTGNICVLCTTVHHTATTWQPNKRLGFKGVFYYNMQIGYFSFQIIRAYLFI